MTSIEIVCRIARDIAKGHARFHVEPWWVLKTHLRHVHKHHNFFPRAAFFRNKRDRQGRQVVRGFRWGVYVLGFEFGNRDGWQQEDEAEGRTP